MTLYIYTHVSDIVKVQQKAPFQQKSWRCFKKTRTAASFQVKKGVPFADAEAIKGGRFRSAVGWFRLSFVFIESGRRYRFILDSDNMDLYKAKLVHIF
jgi:hypothetical protein